MIINENPSNSVHNLEKDIPKEKNNRQNADWDISNAPKNYLTLVLAQGGMAFFSFASVWLITKTIGSEGYGGIVAVIAASQFVQIFINWSITSLSRFGVEEFVETGKITKSFWMRSLIFFPNLIFVLLGSLFWLAPLAGWLKIPSSATWLIILHIVATAVWLHIQFAFQGVKMLRLQGILGAVERALTFISLLLLIGLQRISGETFVWCYILPPLIMSAIGFVILRPFIDLKDSFDKVKFRKILFHSLPLIPFALVGYLSTSQLDAFFITNYLSQKALGIYSVATQTSGIMLQLPHFANMLLLSLFVSLQTNKETDTIKGFFEHVVPSITLAWGFFCIIAAISGNLLIHMVFGEEFREAGKPLWILLAGAAVFAPALFGFLAYSQAISANYITSVAAVISAFVNLSLNFLLIPRLGMIGCALATFFSLLSFVIVVVFFV